MLIAFNGATTMKADLATDIHVAWAAGYDLLEIWAAKLDDYLAAHSMAELKDLFTKVRPYSINSIEQITFRHQAGYQEVQARCRRLSEIAQALDCPYIVVVPSPLPAGMSKDEVRNESVRVLRDLAGIAAEHRIGLAFEFLGFADCSVNNLADCWKIVEEVNRENVGLVIDTFHFHVGSSTLESLGEIDPAKLFIFHINDAEDRPKEQLTDAQRLLPGEGIIPLKDILAALKEIGYDRLVSIELFRPEYWEWEPLRVAQEAKERIEGLLHGLPG